MIGFITFLHIIICIFLVIVVLMQAGRGGGLTESFSSAESLFGAQTSSVMVKTTTVLAAFFIVTSLSLAFLSAQKSQSLMASHGGTKGAFTDEKPLNQKPFARNTKPAVNKTTTVPMATSGTQTTEVPGIPKVTQDAQPIQAPENTGKPQASGAVTEQTAK